MLNIKTLISAKETFNDLPFEAILKTAILHQGLAFSKKALIHCSKFKSKSYFIFSFDHVTQNDLDSLYKHAVPEEIALMHGPYNLKRTIISVRINPQSPFHIDYDEGEHKLNLKINQDIVSEVHLQKKPNYYEVNLENSKPVSDITPTIQWGYLIYITAFRLCQYWGKTEECQFCDINENYRQQKKERSYTGVKSINDIIEALQIIHDHDKEHTSKAYTVTGGSITSRLNNLNEVDFYSQYAAAIEKKFPGRWISKAVVQALVEDEVRQLKDSGYQIYHPNYEVWDKNLFVKICPGKQRYVGRDEWMKRIVDSAKYFGPENVIPNFVAGVELAKPYGFATVDEALTSTQEGLDFFMSQQICPRFTLWCPEPLTTLGKQNSAPPLEYFLKLLRVYRDTHKKYKLPIPPGYGEPGVGKAVFSVSAFMDVLE